MEMDSSGSKRCQIVFFYLGGPVRQWKVAAALRLFTSFGAIVAFVFVINSVFEAKCR